MYGLAPDWTGRRTLGGGGISAGEVTHVALRHHSGVSGPGHHDEPVLVVDTRFGERRALGDAPYRAILHLEAGLHLETGLHLEAGRYHDELPEESLARHQGRWRPWTFPVEGRDQVFWGQEAGDRWAAFARAGGVQVIVCATRWDRRDVHLAVVDRTAYLGRPPPEQTAQLHR